MTLFDTSFLRKLEYLSLVARRAFRGQFLGQRSARQLGGGIEFADHRSYSAGDDYRYLDWNVFARHRQLILKRFQEEEDLHVYLLIDCSSSMAFGTPSKFDLARQLTACLAYIALADLDRVAVTGFAGDVVADFPLTRGKPQILALLRFLEGLSATGSNTDLTRAIKALLHQGTKRGLAIVVSDFYDNAGIERGLDTLRYMAFDPTVIHIFDRAQAEPTFAGDLELVDAESGRARKVTVTERTLQQYRQVFQQFLTSVQLYCSQNGVGCVQTSSEIPFDEVVLKMIHSSVTK